MGVSVEVSILFEYRNNHLYYKLILNADVGVFVLSLFI